MSSTEIKNYNLCLKALEAKKDIEWRFIELGKMLHDIKEGRHYESGWESWDGFCTELKLSQSSVSKLLRIYEVFVLGYSIKPEQLANAGGWSAVAELLPLISPEETSPARVRELLGIATTQSRKDLRTTISEVKRGKPCQHKNTHELHLICCDDCPERWHAPSKV